MILLADDCLIFRTADGEDIPYSAESISVELMGDTADMFDPEFIKHAAAAVFHYFRADLGREFVSVAEFSLALEKVLRGFNLAAVEAQPDNPVPRVVQSDLSRLAAEANPAGELFFFPILRHELRTQLEQCPQLLCFRGIRPCVMQLTRARRWSHRCQALQDQIVEFLRSCLSQDNPGGNCALLVK